MHPVGFVPIDLIAEARSNFMKIASIISSLVNAKMQVVGITEETTVLGVSSLALRDNTGGLRPSRLE